MCFLSQFLLVSIVTIIWKVYKSNSTLSINRNQTLCWMAAFLYTFNYHIKILMWLRFTKNDKNNDISFYRRKWCHYHFRYCSCRWYCRRCRHHYIHIIVIVIFIVIDNINIDIITIIIISLIGWPLGVLLTQINRLIFASCVVIQFENRPKQGEAFDFATM